MRSRFWQNEKGSIAVTFGIVAVPMIIAMGAAVDYARASGQQTAMRGALDAALLAAKRTNDPSQREPVARQVYAAHQSPARTNERLTFWTSNGRYYGKAEADVPTTMGSLLTPKIKISAQAAASGGNGIVCVLLLAPTGTGLSMGSSSQITMPGCEVHVKSVSDRAVMLNSSAAVVSRSLCAAGAISAANNRDNYFSRCHTIDDVWAAKMPKLAADNVCRYDGRLYNNRNLPPQTLEPGAICNGLDFGNAATVTFTPGIYRIRGGALQFAGGSRVIAEGVTFYFEDSQSILVLGNNNGAGNVRISLSPPTTGVTAGITMFEAPGIPTPSSMTLVSAGDLVTDGLFYLPSRDLTLNSSSAMTARKMNIVARTATFSSSSTWQAEPIPQENLRGTTGPLTLVE
jgi:Flp pilus assembly protein TadG